MPPVVEEKSMVPTVLVGVGGTGAEVLSRMRRLIEESYGSLRKFPIVSFLWIDTNIDYKLDDQQAAGSPLQDHEKHWASVSGNEVRNIMSNMERFPWIESWFPQELERSINALEAGAGQIRAYGRFAFFYNYAKIRDRFNEACSRVKGHESEMQKQYGIRIGGNALNVFVVGSLSGGTGSGMIIDLAYCIRSWLRGQSSSSITAIVPMPTAFSGIKVGEAVLANGYAALMELSYFSDDRTEYVAQFGRDLVNEVRDKRAPFDFTYLVGSKNGEREFSLTELRELIAQNIFLDLTSDFAPHKLSIRDNIKGAWLEADPGGRGYPKNFMSFGLATIEVPVVQIRSTLSNRLAKDLVQWWLNESALLPPNMVDLVQTDFLKRDRLSESELLTDLASGSSKSLVSDISAWVNTLRNEIATENKLQCTSQGFNPGAEQGNILQFSQYLTSKADEFRNNQLRETGTDPRLHGAFLQTMYDNRNRIIQRGRASLEVELYSIIRDRTKGVKFADAFIVTIRQLLTTAEEKFRRESEKNWQPNETNRQRQYEGALQEIARFKDSFGLRKQDQMEKYAEEALSGLEGSCIALLQRKARDLGREVLTQLREELDRLEQRLARFNQKLHQLRDEFQQNADQDAERADALNINGMKLYAREEFNLLYQDLLERLAGSSEGSKSRYELGLDQICRTLSEDVLKAMSPLWKQTRSADEVMQLFDITQLPDVNYEDLKEKITEQTRSVMLKAPEESRLKQDLTACDRLFRVLQNDPESIRSNIRLVHQRSKPLILLSEGEMSAANFAPRINSKVALIGGMNTSDPAAIKLRPYLQERVGRSDSITPLGDDERHRIIFVQEIGGFSLRCVDGMRELQRSYQDWRGKVIEAKRDQIQGGNRTLPAPVHIQKNPPFWDVFPEDPKVFDLVVLARALEILKVEENRNTQAKVIRYQRKTVTSVEPVDIASTWQEAVQVLEVPACRPDREEIQSQIDKKLRAADQSASKQVLCDQLLSYLKQRETELVKVGGTDSPEYKREFTLVESVIARYKLKTADSEPIPAPSTEVRASSDRHIGFDVSPSVASPQSKTTQFEQYLTGLSSLGLPSDAFIMSAQAKAVEFAIEPLIAEPMWRKFVNVSQPSPQELEYENYLVQLANFKLPRDAFLSAAAAKASELGIDRSIAEMIQAKFIE
ncbi:MAG: hypothetical protein HC899_21930 [Leptolyngbyaceae cyanobacterium SM1_4_3]|nr:hypothetical protein [Leptolyngbyaceae cyanobacterium SM1_4_3]